MIPQLLQFQQILQDKVSEITELLKNEAKVTLCIRIPGNDEADIVLTNDDLYEVESEIKRTIQRAGIIRKH